MNHNLCVTLLFSGLLFLQLSYHMLALNTPAPSGACSASGKCEEHGVGRPGGTSAQGITPWHPEDPGAAPLWLPGPRGKQRAHRKSLFVLVYSVRFSLPVTVLFYLDMISSLFFL